MPESQKQMAEREESCGRTKSCGKSGGRKGRRKESHDRGHWYKYKKGIS